VQAEPLRVAGARTWVFRPGSAFAGRGPARATRLFPRRDPVPKVWHEVDLASRRNWLRSHGAYRRRDRLCREEIDRLCRRNGLDITRFESEQLDPLYELALEIRVTQLARDDFTHRDLAVGGNRQPQYKLAFE